ncbi:hypothetical protein L208DRAFT_1393929 [Tricholoma matsutake]|nr:hypothetical protein L208DRAFT_1393929 [Tricholoma matsutake 945]
MKSRIPHPRSADAHQLDKHPQQSRDDSSTVYAALKLLGAPHIEHEEFIRLYRGSLADALFFVSEHMKGRRQVAFARAEIHQLRELRSKSHLRQPHDTARSAVEKASSSLSGVRHTAEMYRKQMDDRKANVAKSQTQIDKLKEGLRQRQEVNLLLDILEHKEKLRVRRIQEMIGMFSNLRYD